MKLTDPLFATTSINIVLSASLIFGEALKGSIRMPDTFVRVR